MRQDRQIDEEIGKLYYFKKPEQLATTFHLLDV
jgi:hypothetical protein